MHEGPFVSHYFPEIMKLNLARFQFQDGAIKLLDNPVPFIFGYTGHKLAVKPVGLN